MRWEAESYSGPTQPDEIRRLFMNTRSIRFGTIAFVLAATALAASPLCAQHLQPDPRDYPTTVAGATAFLEHAETELGQRWIKLLRVKWVQWTFITHDTALIAADANEAYTAAAVPFVKEAARFDELALPADHRRKLDILKSLLVMPAPSDPEQMTEIARLAQELTAMAGRGQYCQDDGTCFELDSLSGIVARSRDPDSLHHAWDTYRMPAPPMREKYRRFVALMNQGARELGFADVGEMWRSTYDMDPTAFIAELDRVWEQVKPLYEALHCYVRAKLQDYYGEEIVPDGEPIPAHLLGSMSGSGWAGIFDLVAPQDADPGYDLTQILREHAVDEREMVEYGERFFTSLGFEPLPETFWERSLFTKPADRDVVCNASAWDLDDKNDIRIKMCIEITGRHLETVHHELGHNFYQRAYSHQPVLYRASANYGFHEALGSTIALSLTPRYLVMVGLLDQEPAAPQESSSPQRSPPHEPIRRVRLGLPYSVRLVFRSMQKGRSRS